MSSIIHPTETEKDHREEENEHREGDVARSIEQRTARLPSDTFLWAAGASIVGSLALQMLGKKDDSTFVGQWAPTLLLLGVYNKLVKQAGSDAASRRGL